MLHLHHVSTSNTLDVVVRLIRGRTIVATFAPHQKAVMNVEFDGILPVIPGAQPLVYRQARNGVIDVPRDNVAYLERLPNGVALQYACRHAPQNTVLFSASAGIAQPRPSLA
ncbi:MULTISPECIES: hypothetical protein [Xanthomonas]|uniref:Uncharacterized protein n=1 Tax=Xanthomonas cucurbitae TaxID=56453 RepID=A0A2S7DT78_9XANT|nr:hypothetical protein [Xanthomonas cucurbitae]PPU77005.1 hypothetical protein XcuCFBP2542_08015 [Xanthomonas cucurbitae]QHG87733.1 hypothetical protein EBN15_13120 [Xanthomonas cucurbitae]WDM66603.1 hypothetical protein K6981_13810 [Xanthomonas cucurbitae]WDM70483.1 hypothetical protein K6978_13780 [Xanthomonas cucurbitae]WDM74350.1 hypothetical protein K6982_13110 [Xanthomonas cucurbitae]